MIINPKLDDIVLDKIMALDLETTGLQAWEEDITLIAIASFSEVYILQPESYTKDSLRDFFRKVSTRVETLVIQNGKFDAGFIYYHYNVLLRNIHCTLVTAQICENGPDKIGFSLVEILQRWLGITHANAEDKEWFQKSFTDPILRKNIGLIPEIVKKQMSYAAEDVAHLDPLYRKQMEQVKRLELEIIYKLEHKLLPVLVKMEIEGIKIDDEGWRELIHTYWEPELKRIEKELDEEVNRLLGGMAGEYRYTTKRNRTEVAQFGLFGERSSTLIEADNSLSYTSTQHLLELIKFLGLEAPTDEGGKESLEENCLVLYLSENDNTPITRFIELLILHRKQSKLLSTYGLSFLDKLDKNSHIHTSYTQTRTTSGRLSSKSPNLQNIPKAPKEEPKKDIRRFFIARKGYSLITSDMNSAEVRLAADFSQEPILLGNILEGQDIHSDLSTVSFSILFDEPVLINKSHDKFTINGHEYIPEELRDEHKSVVFAKFYKGGPARVYGVLSEYINRHRRASDRKKVSKQISDALEAEMPVLSRFLDDTIALGKRQGYLRANEFGRIRFFKPDAYADIANLPIQGSNADATKVAMIKINEYFETNNLDARLVLSVHDEVCVECADNIVDIVAPKVKEIMAFSLGYFLKTIPGDATVKVSKFWSK